MLVSIQASAKLSIGGTFRHPPGRVGKLGSGREAWISYGLLDKTRYSWFCYIFRYFRPPVKRSTG